MRFSISKIKCFKSCRRKYELRYIEGLKPVQKAEALEVGSNYHKLLEELNTTGELPECDYSKEYAMACAYKKYIYPKFKVVEAEKWIEKKLDATDECIAHDDVLVGCVDAIADDGHIVEHKSTGFEITEQYEYNLLWDEQILAYMYMTGHRKVHYTVCRKPTIRQKQNEDEEQFFERMVAWYDEDTDSKIRLLEIERTDEEVEQFEKELYDMVSMIENASNFYRSTCYCNMFGRRCDYSSVCLHYNPNEQYIEFEKENNEYEPEKD